MTRKSAIDAAILIVSARTVLVDLLRSLTRVNSPQARFTTMKTMNSMARNLSMAVPAIVCTAAPVSESRACMKGRRFTAPPVGLTVFCAAVAGAALSLSYWQHSRVQLKHGLQQLAEQRSAMPPGDMAELAGLVASELLWRPARAVGTYDSGRGFLVDNRIHGRQPGFHVVTPLDLGGTWLLVNRGWMPLPPVRSDAAAPPPPPGLVTVTGLLAPDSGDAFELGGERERGPIRQNLHIDDWVDETGESALPVVMLADASPGGLVAVSAVPDYGADRSRGYRLQWLALALVAVACWLAVALRPPR